MKKKEKVIVTKTKELDVYYCDACKRKVGHEEEVTLAFDNPMHKPDINKHIHTIWYDGKLNISKFICNDCYTEYQKLHDQATKTFFNKYGIEINERD